MNNCDKVFTMIKYLHVYLIHALEYFRRHERIHTGKNLTDEVSRSQSSSRHRTHKAFHRYRDCNKSYVPIRYAQSNVNYFPHKKHR